MSTNNGMKNSEKLIILINLKSVLLCEALHKSMSREINSCKIYSANNIGPLRNLKPDLTLVDRANLNQELFLKWPETRVILIDTGISEEDIVQLMKNYKLYGVLSTEEDFQKLKKALQVVKAGQIWIDNGKLVALLHGKNSNPAAETHKKVSKKEARIIELVAEGYKNKEIASILVLSEQTIKSHLTRIFKKMMVTNRSQLVSLTIRNKIFAHHMPSS